ncbi:MAG TPA: hypothetical protein VHN78_14880, partial [Chloroflexota bacterium]|nr:hypothetical protein [Chloroflexota bacterium]
MKRPRHDKAGRALVRALVAGILALVTGLAPAAALPASADVIGTLRARINSAQQHLQELRARQRTQQSLVENLRGVTGGYALELSRVEQALHATINRLLQAEADLQQVEADIQELERQIAEKEAAVESRSGVYTTRLRALYKFARVSPLEQLLAASDFSDALQRVTMMQAVARVDSRLLAQLRTERAELLQARLQLQDKQEQALTLRDEIQAQRETLEQRRAEQEAVLEQARQHQSQAEQALTLF